MKMRLLAAAVIAAGFVAAPARAADADPLWPEKSDQVMKLNIRQILESDIIKKYALTNVKQAMEGKDAQKMLKELGIDPLKDIDSVSVGLWKDDPKAKSAKDVHGLLILRGKFDATKLFEAVEKAVQKDGDKMSIIKEGNVKLVKITPDKPEMPEVLYATMANENMILASTDKKLLLEGIKTADDKTAKAVLKPALAELVKAADSKASFFGCSLASGEGIELPPNPAFDDVDKFKEQTKHIVSSAMTVRVTGDIALEMTMHMKTAETADDLGGTFKELLDKARVFLPIIAMQAPQFKPIVDDVKKNLKSSVDSKNIKMSLKITGDSIGKAVGVDE